MDRGADLREAYPVHPVHESDALTGKGTRPDAWGRVPDAWGRVPDVRAPIQGPFGAPIHAARCTEVAVPCIRWQRRQLGPVPVVRLVHTVQAPPDQALMQNPPAGRGIARE